MADSYPWYRARSSGNLKSFAQVENEARFARRVSLLMKEVPLLGEQGEQLRQLAMSDDDDDQMLTTAFNVVGAIGLSSRVEALNKQGLEARLAQLDVMPRASADALIKAGLETTAPSKGLGERILGLPFAMPLAAGRALQGVARPVTGPVMGALQGVAGSAMGGAKSVAKFGLNALSYPSEEVNRVTRVAEIMRSGRSVLDETGETQEGLEARTGIDAPAYREGGWSNYFKTGSPLPLLAGPAAPGMMIAAELSHPGTIIPDLWGALQTWKEIGHKGQDDYLPASQYAAYDLIEGELPGQGKDLLQIAMSMVNGESIPAERKAELSEAFKSPVLRKALSTLEAGRSSPGRATARGVWDVVPGLDGEPDMASWTSGGRYLSGGVDFAWTVIMDPTLVLGKASKAMKLRKYAMKADGIDKTIVLEGASDYYRGVQNGDLELIVQGRAATKKSDSWNLKTGEWVSEFVDDVAGAVETGDWANVLRTYPGIQSQKDNITVYHEWMVAKAAELAADPNADETVLALAGQMKNGLVNPKNVFQFIRHLDGTKRPLSDVDEVAGFNDSASLRLFGYDPKATLFPHVSQARRARLWVDDKFGSWEGWQEIDGKVPPAVVEQILRETADELSPLAQADDVTVKELDDAVNAVGFGEKEKGLIEDAIAIEAGQPRGLDQTLSFRKEFHIKTQVAALYGALTTQAPGEKVSLEGPDAIAEGVAMIKMLAAAGGLPRSLVDQNINMFANGTTAQRQMQLIGMVGDMLTATGARNTPEGEAMFQRYVTGESRAFGFAENVYNGKVSPGRGGENLLVKQSIEADHAPRIWDGPSYKDVLVATRRLNVARMMSGNLRDSWVEAFFVNIWKPAQLLRMAYPLRAAADEILPYIGSHSLPAYVRSAYLEPRAGMGIVGKEGVRAAADPEGLKIQRGRGVAPFQPLRVIGRFMGEWSRTSDEALRSLTREELISNDLTFVEMLGEVGRDAAAAERVEQYISEKVPGMMAARKKSPKAIKYALDLAHRIMHESDELFHEKITRGHRLGEDLARAILKKYPDYESRVNFLAGTIANSQTFSGAWAASVHSTLNESIGSGFRLSGGMMLNDPNTKTGFKFVRVRGKKNDQGWVPASADGTFLMQRAYRLEQLYGSYKARTAMDTLGHYVEKETLESLGKFRSRNSPGEGRTRGKQKQQAKVEDVKRLRRNLGELASRKRYEGDREKALVDAASYLPHKIAELEVELLELYGNPRADKRKLIEAYKELVSLSRAEKSLPKKTRTLLLDTNLRSGELSDNMDWLSQQALSRIHAALRDPSSSPELRRMIRASVVGGKPVVQPLPRDHTRLYGVLVDRGQAEQLVTALRSAVTDGDPADGLRGALERNLRNQGIRDKATLEAVWSSLHPSSADMDLEGAFEILRAQMVESGGPYIPGSYGLTSDERIAYAVRDAIQETIGMDVIKPTLGYVDQPDSAMNGLYGLRKLSGSVFGMDPYRAGDLKALDPDNIEKFWRLRTSDGRVLTVPEGEKVLASGNVLARTRVGVQTSSRKPWGGRLNPFLTKRSSRGAVLYDEEAIKDDFENGLEFIHGKAFSASSQDGSFAWADNAVPLDINELVALRKAKLLDELVELRSHPKLSPKDKKRIDQLNDPLYLLLQYREASMGDAIGLAEKTLTERAVASKEAMRNAGVFGTETEYRKLMLWGGDPRAKVADIPNVGKLRKAGLLQEFKKISRQATFTDKRVVDPSIKAESAAVAKVLGEEFGIDIPEFAGSLDLEQYQKFLIAREQALSVLRPTGTGRYSAVTPEALAREKEAVAFALNEIGYKPPPGRKALGRSTFKGTYSTEELDGGYEVLGMILGSGVTEDAALKAHAQDILSEVMERVRSSENGEIMTEITTALRDGNLTMNTLVEGRPLAHHGVGEYQGFEIVPEPHGLEKWKNWNDLTHENVFNPLIGAISRTPQMVDNLYVASKEYASMLANLRSTAEHVGAVGQILTRFELDVERFEGVNSSLASRMLDDMKFAQGDPEADLVRAFLGAKANPEGASKALSKFAADADIADIADVDVEDVGGELLDQTEFEAIQGWMRREAMAHKTYYERVNSRAVTLTAAFIDDHRIRSQFQEFVGPVVLPYWYAEEQALRRIGRGMVLNPAMFRKGQLLMNGMRNLGVIDKDNRGNEVFIIPGSEILSTAVAKAAGHVLGNEAFDVLASPLTMRTSYMFQGGGIDERKVPFGPVVGMVVNTLAAAHPEREWRTEGQRSMFQSLVPGPASGLYEAFIKDPDPTQLASATVAAIGILEDSGHGLPDNPTVKERQDFIDDVRQVVRAYGVGRYLSGMLSFTKTVPMDQGGMFTKEFADLLAKGYEYDDALSVFLEGKHPSAIVYTIFPTDNLSNTPFGSGSAAYKYMLENEDLLQNAPEAAGWLIPGAKSDEFDPKAYAKQFALGLRANRSMEEIVDLYQIRAASPEYFEKRRVSVAAQRGQQAGLGQSRAGDERIKENVRLLKEDWDMYSKSYRLRHPVFADNLTGEGKGRRLKAIDDLLWMTDPSVAAEGDARAAEIRPLLLALEKFNLEYHVYVGDTSKTAKAVKKALVDQFITNTWLLRRPNTVGAEFWDSMIEPDLPEEAFLVETRLKGV